jgi:hypothetical protein
VIALLRRRQETSFHHRRLAVGLFGSSTDRWPRRNRQPVTVLARLGHFIAGVALGLVVALVLIWIATGCP